MTRSEAEAHAADQGHLLRPWQPCYGECRLAFAECRRCGDVIQAHGDLLVAYDWPLLREECRGRRRRRRVANRRGVPARRVGGGGHN